MKAIGILSGSLAWLIALACFPLLTLFLTAAALAVFSFVK